jgi:two-component system, NtrC family, sensor kinase
MLKLFYNFLFLFAFLFAFQKQAIADDAIVFKGGRTLIGNDVYVFIDSTGKYSADDAVTKGTFVRNISNTPNFDLTSATIWIKFTVQNKSNVNRMFLQLDNALIDTCKLFKVNGTSAELLAGYGAAQVYNQRKYKYPDFLFDIDVPSDSTGTYLVKVNSSEQLLLPLIIGDREAISEAQNTKDIIFGLLSGILLVMLFYNLFIYFSTKDKSYLYYVLYIFFIGITQTTITGYTYKYLFPDSPYLYSTTLVVGASLAGVTAIIFIRTFLHTATQTPILDKFLIAGAVIYGSGAIVRLAGNDSISSRIIDVSALYGTLLTYIVAIKLVVKNYRPARFFAIAWTIFIVGIVLFVLRNLGILPYNNFTNYTMQVGVAIEVAMLSLALADKINIFRKEKEESQAQAMAALEENAKIISDQNVMLEQKVTERTVELKASNEELNKTLHELKEAETQLVESEKMASLGQLTAGIAHEINNPINFVTSNVKPLKRDVEMMITMIEEFESISLSEGSVDEKKDKVNALKEEYDFDYLKTEIDYLLKGINEGSSRTAEIVKGLRIFSRLDEDDLKKASINEGIDSTLIIANNLLENRVEIIKDYGNLPMVECYAGKLNQVFLNIITNGIHAVKARHKEGKGQVMIKTYASEESVFISIKDNGTGMDENTKKKLFEPFFTTKEVGEGTGLGLSIAWNTIKKHNGNVTVNSEQGVGTEFLLEIPIIHK